VVELDGHYHLEPAQKEYDAQRDAYLQARGYEVLRLANDEVDFQFERTCQIISEAVSRKLR
jgi:very-short-patch-repair endonuclease